MYRLQQSQVAISRDTALALLLERGSVHNCSAIFKFESFGQGNITFVATISFEDSCRSINYTCTVPVTHPMFQTEIKQMYVRIEEVLDYITYKVV